MEHVISSCKKYQEIDKQGECDIDCLSEFLSSLDKSTFSNQMTFKFVDEQLKTCNMISGSFIGINNNLNMF